MPKGPLKSDVNPTEALSTATDDYQIVSDKALAEMRDTPIKPEERHPADVVAARDAIFGPK